MAEKKFWYHPVSAMVVLRGSFGSSEAETGEGSGASRKWGNSPRFLAPGAGRSSTGSS